MDVTRVEVSKKSVSFSLRSLRSLLAIEKHYFMTKVGRRSLKIFTKERNDKPNSEHDFGGLCCKLSC